MLENIVFVNDYLTKSKLPASDFVINPYIGCANGCKYCYACFMKRFTGHTEPWGEFVDVKICDKPINLNKINGKSLCLSSVTDCYNPLEEKYCITKNILEQLISADSEISIVTKSALILRDKELLKKFNNLTVAFSVNTLDEGFKNDMDKASSIADRLNALKILHDDGIKTVLFMSPIFPVLTDFKKIIEATSEYVDTYWFENLNLRGSFKNGILTYIKEKYSDLYPLYNQIYNLKDKSFWESLAFEINDFCTTNNVDFINYFYHEQIRKN
ncbi:MAG: radical SAM protein [Clostridia bacterium]